MSDRLISEQAVMESLTKEYNRRRTGDGLKLAWIEKAVHATPTASDWDRYSTKLWKEAYERGKRDAQAEQTDCDYCHENFDGYVRPIEKNSHAFIYFGMNGWELNLRAKGWHGSANITYCPMCGRRLERG